jgi:hypothetical protein
MLKDASAPLDWVPILPSTQSVIWSFKVDGFRVGTAAETKIKKHGYLLETPSYATLDTITSLMEIPA